MPLGGDVDGNVQLPPASLVEGWLSAWRMKVDAGPIPALVVLERERLPVERTVAISVLFKAVLGPETTGGLRVAQEVWVLSALAASASSTPSGVEHRTRPDRSASSEERDPVPLEISPRKQEECPAQLLGRVRFPVTDKSGILTR